MDSRPTDETMQLLLISDSSERAAMLRQLMEQQGLHGEIRRLDPGRSAIACARHSGPYRGEATPDVVLLDFADPGRRNKTVIKDIALGSRRVDTPVVLLTSRESEAALHSDELRFDENSVFAPTTLSCFIRKMRQHSRQRFLRALSVMAGLGPILVRMPADFARQDSDETALSA